MPRWYTDGKAAGEVELMEVRELYRGLSCRLVNKPPKAQPECEHSGVTFQHTKCGSQIDEEVGEAVRFVVHEAV